MQYQWNIGDKTLTDVGGKGPRRRGVEFSGFEKENRRGVVAAEGEGECRLRGFPIWALSSGHMRELC